MFGYSCKDGDSNAYKCVYVIVQRQQKRKNTPHTKRDGARTLLFDFQRIKISCFKTAVLKNACSCYICSPSFRNCPGWSFCLPVTQRIKITVTQIMKRYYHKQCILRHHNINDRTYETIAFLFRPSDIYRHIAQP